MNREELVQSLQDQLADNEQIGAYIKAKIEENFPNLDKDKSEEDELMWYGLYNEIFQSVMIEVLHRMSGKE